MSRPKVKKVMPKKKHRLLAEDVPQEMIISPADKSPDKQKIIQDALLVIAHRVLKERAEEIKRRAKHYLMNKGIKFE